MGAAENYFNSLPLDQQAAATASGSGPGGPNFAKWFQNAKAAGAVPTDGSAPLVAPAGARPGELGGGGNQGVQGANAADVRAQGQGKSEDYARFGKDVVDDWISRWPYNPETGKFTNLYGDQVDKPDERGPNTPRNMNGTGGRGDYGYGYNATGVGDDPSMKRGGGGRGGGGANPAQQQGGVDNGYLQRQLLGQAQQGAVGNGGVALNAGGTFTVGDQPPAPGVPPPGAPGAAPAAAPAQPNAAYNGGGAAPNAVAAAVPAMQNTLQGGSA